MSGKHGARLVRWFGDRVGPLDDLAISSVPWHSATFAGTRYGLAFSTVTEMPTETLVESDFAIGTGFVADIGASVTRLGEAWRYRIDVLVVDEA